MLFWQGCDLPWAVRFPGLPHAVHPTQLYEAFYDIMLFAFLIARRKRVRFEGEISLLYLLLYGIGRYMIEFVREPSWMWMGLTSNQWLSIAIMIAAFIVFSISPPQGTVPMMPFIFQMVHRDCTAQVFFLFSLMVTWAAPISALRKLISIGTDFPIYFLKENQA